jgi:hypothetical protein
MRDVDLPELDCITGEPSGDSITLTLRSHPDDSDVQF